MGALEELVAAAQGVLEPAAAPPPPPPGSKVLPVALAGAIASAVPPLLSLLAPQRTLSSFAISPDTTAAISLLADHLIRAGLAVRIDDFRPVPQGRVQELGSGV